MKKHFFIAACVIVLAGCSRSGTRYDTAQTDTSTSPEPRSTASRYGLSLAATNATAESRDLDTNAPLPNLSTTGLGAAGSVGTDSGSTNSDLSTRIPAGQSASDLTIPNPAYQQGPLDTALSSKVKTSLHISDSTGKLIELNNVQVTAMKGIVTLKGTVPSEAQKQAIGNEVQKMDGVVIVKNELRVSSESSAQGSATPPEQSGASSSKKD